MGLRWEEWVEIDPTLLRPVDVGVLVGNPARAKARLGWAPSVSFEDLVNMMVDAQLARISGSR